MPELWLQCDPDLHGHHHSFGCPMQVLVAPAALRPLLAVFRPSSPTPARSRALQ